MATLRITCGWTWTCSARCWPGWPQGSPRAWRADLLYPCWTQTCSHSPLSGHCMGTHYKSLSYEFRVVHNTISLFVPEVWNAIVEEYRLEQFSTPSDPDGWKQVAVKFGKRWNFPHCCGSIDGKHVAIRKPDHAGSLYYNYKGFHSILMLALVEADYKFLWVNVGADRRIKLRCWCVPTL